MKVTIEKCQPRPPEDSLPALYRSKWNGAVVLFTRPNGGLVLYAGPGSSNEFGEVDFGFRKCTDADVWERMPDNYTVTLSNG